MQAETNISAQQKNAATPVAKKIRILQGIRQGKIGGGESYLLSLVENLDRDNFESVVLSFTDGPMVERLRKQGITTHVIYTEKPFDIRVWKKVKQLMIDEKIDIVHAHGTRANSNMFWGAKKLKLPTIYTCHAWSFHRDQNPLVKKIRVWSEDYLTSKMNVNICGCEANKNTGKELFRSFDAVVINNSVDYKKFDPTQTYPDVRKELNISYDDIVIASIARFTLQKQPLELIRSFKTVAAKISNAKLLMVGDGELKEQAVALVKELKLEDKIIMQPFRTDVPAILAAADVFVLPSLWEAFPIALLEAMAMGKAVIATNVDGTPEMVTHEDNGLLIDVNNLEADLTAAMLRICMDDTLRQNLQEHAYTSTLNKYSVEILAKKNEEIYYQLAK